MGHFNTEIYSLEKDTGLTSGEKKEEIKFHILSRKYFIFFPLFLSSSTSIPAHLKGRKVLSGPALGMNRNGCFEDAYHVSRSNR